MGLIVINPDMGLTKKKSLNPTFYLKAQRRYGGKYIARQGNHVLAHGRNLKDLFQVMKKKKISHKNDVSIGYVPSSTSAVWTFSRVTQLSWIPYAPR